MTMTQHESVMVNEVVEYLAVNSEEGEKRKVILDCTLGGGGHTKALLGANPNIYVISLDKDIKAIERTCDSLKGFGQRILTLCADFIDLRKALTRKVEIAEIFQSEDFKFSGIIADFGISSDQLNDPERGLTFQVQGPLDMRMNQNSKLTAAEVLNEYAPQQLKRVFITGGLSRGSFELARAIVAARPIRDTNHFRQICEQILIPLERKLSKGKKGSAIATVPFQAVRIEVNNEYGAIKGLLDQVLEFLAPAGRFAAISFHSLEDKLVASTMRGWASAPQTPRGMAVAATFSKGKLLTKKALQPTVAEVAKNPRARSARMRVFEMSGRK